MPGIRYNDGHLPSVVHAKLYLDSFKSYLIRNLNIMLNFSHLIKDKGIFSHGFEFFFTNNFLSPGTLNISHAYLNWVTIY